MEKPFPIEQFRGLIIGNTVTNAMFEEARLINTVYAAGHGLIQGKLSQEKKAHDQATARVAEAMRSGNRQCIAAEKTGIRKSEGSLSPCSRAGPGTVSFLAVHRAQLGRW